MGALMKIYKKVGVLVNHEAKLKGVAKASDYAQNPDLMNTLTKKSH